MAKLPHPPPALPDIDADSLVVVPAGTLLWRVYRAGGRHPAAWNTFRTFGPMANGRLDHHEPPPHEQANRAIYYAADTAATAVVETFQDSRVIDRGEGDPWLVAFELEIDLSSLDLAASWPTRAGASQALATGRRDVCREWSRKIWLAYPSVCALRYPSAMAGGALNLAIFERGRASMPAQPSFNQPLSHPGLAPDLNRIASQYGYSLR